MVVAESRPKNAEEPNHRFPPKIVAIIATYGCFSGTERRRGSVREAFAGSSVQFAASLSAGQEEVGSSELDVVLLGNGAFTQRHAANGRHVRFRAEHVQRNSCRLRFITKQNRKKASFRYPAFVPLLACVSNLPGSWARLDARK